MLQQPVSSRVLVGRSEELAALQERLRSAAAGRGSTVLVSGEAGIGKSRLVSEVRQQAALVLRGNCFEPDSALPFAPILDLLRTYVARKAPAEIAASLGPDSSDLSRLLPELTIGIDAATPAPVPDTEQEKRRLFEGLIRFFARLSEDEPLLLIVEDLHWSDDTSLEFILHLSRRVPTLPILLLLTYRSDEVQPGLQRLLATLDRERGASELALRPLTLEEVDVLLRSMFEQPQPIRPDFLHEIYTLTEGNAFFIEEIVGSLIASGDIYRAGDRWDRKALPELSIPRSVRHAVTQRSENLSPDARRVLQVAAVAGQRFVFDVLLDLTGHDESDLLRLVRELINAQLVVEESAERFAFRHALTREAVYAGLLVRERQAIHRALGETIERLYAGSPSMPLADLAYHFHTAQAWEKALLYAPLAGQRAQELYTPRAAIEHFSRALDAAWQLSETPAVNIYRERGLAHETLGEFDPARRDYEVVLERSRAAGDRRSEWRALMDLGGLWAGYDYARAGGYFEQALQLAQETGDRADVARSLVQVGNWQVNTERPAEAERSLLPISVGSTMTRS